MAVLVERTIFIPPEEYDRLKRLERDYALLLQANHKLGFRIQDDLAELPILRRDLVVTRDHRDRLIESNRSVRGIAETLEKHMAALAIQRDEARAAAESANARSIEHAKQKDLARAERNAAQAKLEQFGRVLFDAAVALSGKGPV